MPDIEAEILIWCSFGFSCKARKLTAWPGWGRDTEKLFRGKKKMSIRQWFNLEEKYTVSLLSWQVQLEDLILSLSKVSVIAQGRLVTFKVFSDFTEFCVQISYKKKDPWTW